MMINSIVGSIVCSLVVLHQFVLTDGAVLPHTHCGFHHRFVTNNLHSIKQDGTTCQADMLLYSPIILPYSCVYYTVVYHWVSHKALQFSASLVKH